jgi:hypothetical protein
VTHSKNIEPHGDRVLAPASPTSSIAILNRQAARRATMAQNDEARRAILIDAQQEFKDALNALKKEDLEARMPVNSTLLFKNIDAVLEQNTHVNIQVSNHETNNHMYLGSRLMFP